MSCPGFAKGDGLVIGRGHVVHPELAHQRLRAGDGVSSNIPTSVVLALQVLGVEQRLAPFIIWR